jgi:hypothetical protein
MTSSSVKKKIVAVCQMTATNSKEDNMRTCLELIKSVKKDCICCNCQLMYVFCLELLLCGLCGKYSSFCIFTKKYIYMYLFHVKIP